MALPPSKKTCRETTTTPPAWQQQQQLLPDEVIEHILMRLPARSVVRCRCLSRSWAAVLSSRGFISRHLHLPTTTTSRRRRPRRFEFFGEADAAWTACLQEHHLAGAGRRVTRSCRGLGLVKNDPTGVYYVCNPSTGQAASLPDGTPVKLDGGRRSGDGYIFGYVSFGLGHDARADRHKVVRLYYPVGGGEAAAGCEVYDVGASSKGYWRPPGAKPPRFAVVGRFGVSNTAAGVFAQGRLHWLATSRRPSTGRRRPEPDSVMSFSLADETFTSIPLPPRACGGGRSSSLGLTVLHGGRLGLVSFYRRRPRDIWTPAAAADEENAHAHPLGSQQQQVWSQLATVAGSGYCEDDDDLYEESLEPVGRPHEDVLFASPSTSATTHLHALSMALLRLPARTLGRLKSVSRSWCAVIESDRFASAHNEHHRRLADRVMFATMPPPPPLMNLNSRVVVSKPCHGLAQVMMSRSPWCGGDRTELLNPVTRARRIFAMDDDDVDRSLSSLDMSSSGVSGGGSSSIGLGYDESRQEHVLVLVAAAGRECKVWRLRENVGSARTVPAPPITPRFLPPPASTVPPVYIDGRIHWMCCSPRAILAFCVRAGAFHVVPAPPPGPGTGTEFLVELRGLLCVVQSCPSTETIMIWSSAAGGRDGEWSREYVIELGRWPEFSPKTVELVVPMAIEPTDDGRILLHTGSSLGYYDPVRRTLETVVGSLYGPDLDHNHPNKKRFFAAALWEESLVRPYDWCHRLWN